jgi:hypothetical protein
MPDADRFEIIPARAAAEFTRLPLAARKILKLCDGVRGHDAICAESPLAPAETGQVLRRLAALGLVAVRAAPATGPRQLTPPGRAWMQSAPLPSGFSDEEEQFFSSSIEHLIEA